VGITIACLDLEIQADLTCDWKKMGNSVKLGLIFQLGERYKAEIESTGKLQWMGVGSIGEVSYATEDV
jgi:hypothetical protein